MKPQATLKRGRLSTPRAQTDRGVVAHRVEGDQTNPIANEEDRKRVSTALRPVALPRAMPRMPSPGPVNGPSSSRRDHVETMSQQEMRRSGMSLSQRAAESGRQIQPGYQTDFRVAPFTLQLTQTPGSLGATGPLHPDLRRSANLSMSTRWHVKDNMGTGSEWSLTLDAGVIARAFPLSGFGSQFSVQRASTPELQRMLRSPAPALSLRSIKSCREHQERGYSARTDGCMTAVHTATPLRREGVDAREPFVRGGAGLETLPRFS